MSKDKLLYISNLDTNNPKHLGILKKARGMCKGFAEGYDVYLEYRKGERFLVETTVSNKALLDKCYKGHLGRIRFYKDIEEWIQKNKIRIVYIRFDHLDNVMLRFFKALRKADVKIYLELPTYPYAGERDKRHKELLKKKKYPEYMAKRIAAIIENKNTKAVSKYIEKIITYTYDGTIWNTPSLCIENGVDCGNIKLREHHNDSSNIIVGVIANLAKWHAVDRFVEGMKTYYANGCPEHEVEFWIVGEGSESPVIRELIDKYGLEDHVIMKGAKTGAELEEIIDNIDIGVGTLGLHRIGLPWGSTIKSKEYCAAGLPFVYASREKALKGDEPFALKFPDDETPINIEEVVRFALKVRNDHTLRAAMREKAEKEYSWASLTKKIFDKT